MGKVNFDLYENAGENELCGLNTKNIKKGVVQWIFVTEECDLKIEVEEIAV